MNTDLQAALTQALLSHEKVWADEEKTILAKNILLDLVEKTDPTIIGLLLGNDDLKRHFFVEINGVLVFKLQDFRFFLDKHSVNNSYTKYANRIGLTDGNRFLKDSSDIVLDFPFKDCVLNGGQSTEEGEEIYFKRNNDQSDSQLYTKLTQKRQEIFFNQTLAFDEIDRLFDAKAFSKFSRYTADGKQAVGEIKRHSDGFLKGVPAENLIIKGNNLIALHSLAKQFKGKVKLIYIDPPYNPKKNGVISKNNTFSYNNYFNRSTWLAFMKNRLEIAKELLSQDGAMIIAIDDNEFKYLGILIDEIFPNYENHCITIVHNPRGIQGTNFSYTHEYAYFILPKGTKAISNRKIEEKNIDFRGLRDNGGESLRKDAKNCFYPIIVDKNTMQIIEFGDICSDDFNPPINIHKNDFVWVYPVDKKGIERKWRYARQSIEKVKDLLKVVTNQQGNYDIQIGKDFGMYRTVWQDTRYDSNEYGTKIINKLVPNNTFSFPKSLWNVYDCLYSVVANDKDAIILDFHAGSGTTAHAVLELNKDGGNRKFIMIEQMNYIETITCERVHQVIKRESINDSFIYAELAPFNETAKQQILACENIDDIKTLFNKLCEKYFLKYNVSVNEFSQIIEEPEFQSLPLDEQKQMVLEMLDLNQMYVSLSEMDDEQFAGCLNDDDKALSRAFYQSAKNQAEKKDGE